MRKVTMNGQRGRQREREDGESRTTRERERRKFVQLYEKEKARMKK
jgi:hypothetical protein